MGYDIFANIQNAAVPISMFGDAARAGAEVGNAIPTKTTSIIQGALKGFEQGQRMRSNEEIISGQQLENQIRQHQVDRLPVQDQIQDLQLERAKTQEEISSLDLQIKQQTEQEELEATKALLKDKAEAAASRSKARERTNSFTTAWQTADPVEKKQMVLSGEWNDVLSNDPKLYQNSVSTIFGDLKEDEKDSVLLSVGKANAYGRYQQNLEKYRKAEVDSLAEISKDFYADEASSLVGKPFESFADQIKEVPAGTYKYDPDTRIIEFDSTGKQIREEIPQSKTEKDWILGNKVIASGVTKESQSRRTKLLKSQRDLNGIHRDAEISELEETYGAAKKQSSEKEAAATQGSFAPEKPGIAVEQPVVGEYKVAPNPNRIKAIDNISFKPSGKIDVAHNPAVYQLTQETLGMNDRDFLEVKPQVKRILETIETGREGWFGRYSLKQRETVFEAEAKIAEYAAGREFDTNKKLQTEITEAQVAAHNRFVDSYETRLKEYTRYWDTVAPRDEAMREMPNYGVTKKVETPRELYILKRYGYYKTLLDNYTESVEAKLQEDKKALTRMSSLSSSVYSDLGKTNAAAR